MSNKPITIEDCRRLVEEILADRIKDRQLGSVSPIIWERGYLTGLLARIALEDHDVRRRLQEMAKHKS